MFIEFGEKVRRLREVIFGKAGDWGGSFLDSHLPCLKSFFILRLSFIVKF